MNHRQQKESLTVDNAPAAVLMTAGSATQIANSSQLNHHDRLYRRGLPRGVCNCGMCLLEKWQDAQPYSETVVRVTNVEAYQPGQFYLRELPCIMAVLERLTLRPSCIVIDGYVWLDANNQPGLGARLYEQLNGNVPLIGVAKTAFLGSQHAVPLCRGKSKRPLFITSVGLASAQAVINIGKMHGVNRMPTILARTDRLSRT